MSKQYIKTGDTLREKKQRVLVSTSGGRTSALMAYLLFTRYQHLYDMVFVFANTSREKEETLLFVHQLEVVFGLPIVWVEAKVWHGQRKSSTHTITNYKDAKRNGEVFTEVIKKYGIPCSSAPHCTREMKRYTINSYAKSIGWDKGTYLTAIGYRSDEPKRVNLIKAAKQNHWYPLFEWGIKKSDVATFWLKQSFDLQLEDWQGNCKLCYKKSKRKLLTQIISDPECTEWIKDMEDEHGYVVPAQYKGDVPLKFFREWESVGDLIAESNLPFEKAVDQSLITDGASYDFELDEQESCSESCEPFDLEDEPLEEEL